MSANARSGQWQTAAHPGPAALRGNLGVALAQAQPATGPGGAWRRGWVLTAIGRFGEAWEELTAAGPVDEPYGAAAAVTRGALLRQVGLHELAEDEDAAVVANAPAGTEIAAAALIGLVADHVGQAADAGELDRRLSAAGKAVAATGSPRQRIRIAWVAGEVAMAQGEPGLAEGRFAAAVDAAQVMGARRHQAKSLGYRALATAAMGQRDAAAALARTALDLAGTCDAWPLQCSAHLLLASIDGDGNHAATAEALRSQMINGLPGDLLGTSGLEGSNRR